MKDRLDLNWTRGAKGFALRVGRSGNPLLHVVPDKRWPHMWRIRHRDNSVSDLLNVARAKDAAQSHALAELRAQEVGKRRLVGAPKRFSGEQLPTPIPEIAEPHALCRDPAQQRSTERSHEAQNRFACGHSDPCAITANQPAPRSSSPRCRPDSGGDGEGGLLDAPLRKRPSDLATDLRPFSLVKDCRDRDHDPCRRRCRQ